MSAAPAASHSAGDPAADLPAVSKVELLPARMLNEFVYCARLFYYEHVEGVFLHSADTKKGAAEPISALLGARLIKALARSGFAAARWGQRVPPPGRINPAAGG